jgi:CheY-like chemotaxis protein
MTEQVIEIVLVEDNPDDLQLALFALKRGGVAPRIHVARDGEEALNYLLRRGPYERGGPQYPPKLILLDLKLPKITGLEVLRELKQNPRTRPYPVVVMTSSTQEKDMMECYQLGANSYIQKPIDFQRFQKIMAELGSYWLSINQTLPVESTQP